MMEVPVAMEEALGVATMEVPVAMEEALGVATMEVPVAMEENKELRTNDYVIEHPPIMAVVVEAAPGHQHSIVVGKVEVVVAE